MYISTSLSSIKPEPTVLKMSLTISLSKPITTLSLLPHFTKPISYFPDLKLRKNPHKKKTTLVVLCKSSEKEEEEKVVKNDEWLKKLPEKNKALYAHSLMCIEAWLRQLGFRQRTDDDPASWVVENGHWHAYLNLDVTDLSIRYLKTGPGNLEKDVERRFSYALSREDIENAILGGP